MAQEMKPKMIVQSVVTAIAILGTGSVAASGFQLLEQNASGLGNAYAGSAAVAENASTIYYNPAGMTKLKKGGLSLGANLIQPSYKFKNEGSSNAPAATGTDGGDAGGPAILPNTYAAAAVTQDLYLGIGIGAPFGLKTEYSPDFAGRFQSSSFDIETLNVNPSLAYRITDKLSFGVGANWQKMTAEYKRNAAVINSLTQNTMITLAADSEAWGWNAGALFDVSSTMTMGLSYRSKIKHKLTGTLTSTSQLVSPDISADASITLPDTWVYSIKQQLGDSWEVLGDISRTGWSSINTVPIFRTSGAAAGSTAQTLDAHFRNTWRVALGGTQKVSDTWKMKYGMAWDQSPVRSAEERLVSLPDNDRLWFTVGTQLQVDKVSTVDLGAAYIYIRDANIDNNQSSAGRGRVTGSYTGNVFILGAQYSLAF
ncbi:outer membrane protein transport protein [Uliginosibacterium sp. H3]|uniref:Outer membrane protein transport protein n=1 Tax=Uliginosibacterium silvisoli TaxID=3114758 RepID=A0ABU6K872_9RHOO|nr:outer membrane protein transport protein [Uliginosibacterium sp. H3]